MRKHYVLHKVPLQPRAGPLRHFLHPVAQTTGAVRVISVSGRELPQGLLPPHRADKESGQPIPQVQYRALTWVAAKIDCCNHNAGNRQQPENIARPAILSKEFQHVGNWVCSHITNVVGLLVKPFSDSLHKKFTSQPSVKRIQDIKPITVWDRDCFSNFRSLSPSNSPHSV